MELIQQLVSSLDVNENQAKGGAGLLFNLAKEKLGSGDFQQLADKNFQLLKSNPQHPSLHFKRIGELWSVRVGARNRALGIDVEGGLQ